MENLVKGDNIGHHITEALMNNMTVTPGDDPDAIRFFYTLCERRDLRFQLCAGENYHEYPPRFMFDECDFYSFSTPLVRTNTNTGDILGIHCPFRLRHINRSWLLESLTHPIFLNQILRSTVL